MRLKEDFHHTIVIERSEFICYVRKCLDEAQAKAFIQEIRRLHPEANHHCYAYIAGQHNELQRSNDAGEPSGTAGVPMLESLKLSGLQDCCAVTVRYFGEGGNDPDGPLHADLFLRPDRQAGLFIKGSGGCCNEDVWRAGGL